MKPQDLLQPRGLSLSHPMGEGRGEGVFGFRVAYLTIS